MKNTFKTLISILMDRDFDPDLICKVIIYPLDKNNILTYLNYVIVIALMSYNENDFIKKYNEYIKGGTYDYSRIKTC